MITKSVWESSLAAFIQEVAGIRGKRLVLGNSGGSGVP